MVEASPARAASRRVPGVRRGFATGEVLCLPQARPAALTGVCATASREVFIVWRSSGGQATLAPCCASKMRGRGARLDVFRFMSGLPGEPGSRRAGGGNTEFAATGAVELIELGRSIVI